MYGSEAVLVCWEEYISRDVGEDDFFLSFCYGRK